MSTIYLCTTLFPSNESHVPLFQSKKEQADYFKSIGSPREVEFQPSLFLESIDVELDLSSAKYYDMLFFNTLGVNGSLNDNNYIYFIVGHKMISTDVTRLFLKLAVMHTYQFNWSVENSFVSRMHSQRWNSDGTPIAYYQDEGLEYGDIIPYDKTEVRRYNENYILCTNVPIGDLQQYQGGDEGGTPPSIAESGDWQQGVMSAKGFRFMKGYEAFAPYKYKDSGGVETIGYGVTKSELNLFNEMVSKQPLEEEWTARKCYDLKIQKYGKPIVAFCKQIGITKQNQFDALCDLSFNAGPGAVCGTPAYTSLPNALKKDPFNESYIRPIWENYLCRDDKGNYLEGLHLRRIAECDIYFKSVYEMREIPTLNSSGQINGKVTSNKGNGWLPESSGSSIRDKIVTSAKKLVGLPYVYGGNYTPLGKDKGTDCSGLMMWAYNDNGLKISRVTYTQINEGKEVSSIDKLQKGDLIFTRFSAPNVPEHVYMYCGVENGKHMICEAPRTGLDIRYIEWQIPSNWRARNLLD